MIYKTALIFIAALLAGCADDNSKPVYGETSGLPVNCRAYIQVSVDGYRSGKFTADEAMNGIERNCGANGISWANNR